MRTADSMCLIAVVVVTQPTPSRNIRDARELLEKVNLVKVSSDLNIDY